jgi:N-acetylglutamate synthase
MKTFSKSLNAVIEAFVMDDYEETMALWRGSEGVGLSDADSREAILRYLERNPGLSLVARENGRIVGAVLCGHDGRRGYIHHLAVHRDHQRRGIGQALVARCLERLRSLGLSKCHAFLLNDNAEGLRFWERVGWTFRRDVGVISKIFG